MIRPNKAGSNGKYNSLSGKFIPSHPEKYKGKSSAVFKSKLEWRMMRYLDTSPAILSWSYEPKGIKYLCSLDQKYHTYYLDFVATIKVGQNKIKTVWIEVKSKKETEKPVDSAKKSKRTFMMENETWVKNQNKWAAAKKEATQCNCEFLIITEEQLI